MSATRRESKSVKARARNIYCTPQERAAIAQLARQAGMTTSAYMVACALPDDEEAVKGRALVLTEADQRALRECVGRLERCIDALLSPGVDTGLSVLQGLEYLVAERQRRLPPRSGTPRAS